MPEVMGTCRQIVCKLAAKLKFIDNTKISPKKQDGVLNMNIHGVVALAKGLGPFFVKLQSLFRSKRQKK
jgi:hypothetical protein